MKILSFKQFVETRDFPPAPGRGLLKKLFGMQITYVDDDMDVTEYPRNKYTHDRNGIRK